MPQIASTGGLFDPDAHNPVATVNNPPVVDSTPGTAGVVSFTQGLAAEYPLNPDMSDPDGDAVGGTVAGAAFPTGISNRTDPNNSAIVYDGLGGAASQAGFTLTPNDGQVNGTPSAAFTIEIVATVFDAIVRQDGGGDFTTPQAAINAGRDKIQIQANSPGGVQTFNSECRQTTSGTEGDEFLVEGRAGDTIIIWDSGFCCELDGVSYGVFRNIQFGRDETLNGWNNGTGILMPGETSPTQSSPEGRFGVEHGLSLHALNGATNHRFDNCIFYAGRQFDGARVTSNCELFGFFNCEFLYAGVPGGSTTQTIDGQQVTRDVGGNGITYGGSRAVFDGCIGRFGGHDTISAEAVYLVFRRCRLDNSWDLYFTGLGNRCMSVEGSRGNSPFGPNLVEECIFRGADIDLTGANDPATKMLARNIICRYNYYLQNNGQVWNNSALEDAGDAEDGGDGWMLYNNTGIDNLYVMQSTDTNIGTGANGHYVEHVVEDNIFAEIGTGRPQDSTHYRYVRSNSDDGGFPNSWRGLLVDGNIFSPIAGVTFRARLQGSTGAGNIAGISAIESNWPANWTNNDDTAPSFEDDSASVRDSTSYTEIYNGLRLANGSVGIGTAKARATATNAGSSATVMTVDPIRARAFADLANPLTWNLAYFNQQGDTVQIRRGAANIGSPVRIVSVDGGNITFAEQRDWQVGDGLFIVRSNGLVQLDKGASQRT